ncbi:Dehydrogenase/reductase SDR family member 13 [Hondaea fermentalgiana]|uniref:Dehydrogenase/reductase SDR family member 13 n=1 Tax=Hondaea fermentalgiana TaxID=2315210 RepID=A0A2R5G5D7_9STRA|nr:Dehydrogenase/reductase SDR family member 13 [Hondaea fermentalgiana]|eukprot:GBG25755.1 Dehydrogenase/reductase SDR family member 13 [Hondaea fermentalgiana]
MTLLSCATIVALVVVVVSVAINLSFDAKLRKYWPVPEWSVEDIPSLEGQTALVTGANTGLGYATSLELLKHGAKVIVATRSEKKGIDTVKRLQAEPDLPAKYRENAIAPKVALELSSLKSVAEFAEYIKDTEPQLNMLINNAGLNPLNFSLSEDGYELRFAVNHMAHYALTLALVPLLEAGAPARVVVVSSLGHQFAAKDCFDFSTLNDESKYEMMPAYGRSKLANILFARSLARKVKDKQIYVNSAHPGFVATDFGRELVDMAAEYMSRENAESLVKSVFGAFAMSPQDGAATQLFLAMPEVAERNITGEYYVPMARKHDSHFFALAGGASPEALDDELAEKLWQWTAKETGIDL